MTAKRTPDPRVIEAAHDRTDAVPRDKSYRRGDGALSQARVLCFESRRASELCALLARHGASARSVSAMREVAVDGHSAALSFWQRLANDEIDAVAFMTGGAVTGLASAVAAAVQPTELARNLQRTTVICRGPKPRAALRELGVRGASGTEEPHTWQEVIDAFDALPSRPVRVALLEHGESSPRLVKALARRGCEVSCVAVYRWALPTDQTELEQAVRDLADGADCDIVVFTSGRQVDHVMQVAARLGLGDQVRRRAQTASVVCSVGPACSERLRAHGIAVDLEPEHPKMGHLVRELASRADQLLGAKRAAGESPS